MNPVRVFVGAELHQVEDATDCKFWAAEARPGGVSVAVASYQSVELIYDMRGCGLDASVEEEDKPPSWRRGEDKILDDIEREL